MTFNEIIDNIKVSWISIPGDSGEERCIATLAVTAGASVTRLRATIDPETRDEAERACRVSIIDQLYADCRGQLIDAIGAYDKADKSDTEVRIRVTRKLLEAAHFQVPKFQEQG